MRIRTLVSIAGIGLFIAPLACAPKKGPPVEPEADPMAVSVPADPAARIRELKGRADQLVSYADQLPGRDEEEFRRLMTRGLEDLGQSLRLAQPPATDGAFRVQLESIFGASRELRTRSLEYPLRPQTTAALRSAHNALTGVKQRVFPENADLQTQLDAQATALRPLETEQGALYRLASAEAFRQAVKTLQQVADLYAARLPADAPATQVTTPATSEAPTAAPATPEQNVPTTTTVTPAPEAAPTPQPAPEPATAPTPAPQPELNK